MKVLSNPYNGSYDLSIIGLGYESRAEYQFNKNKEILGHIVSVGYDKYTNFFNYPGLKDKYKSSGIDIIEGNDDDVIFNTINWLNDEICTDKPINVFIDITVMSRKRLSALIYHLLENLPKKSTLTISYELSSFVQAPSGLSPIRKVGEVIPQLSGDIGDLNYPTSVVLGLGYEEGKALGLVNFIDAEYNYIFVPIGKDIRFDRTVSDNNRILFEGIPENRIFKYRLEHPYNTYLDLRDLVLSISEFSSPLLAPLGPKIFAAISVVLAKELDQGMPVWRVSSEQEEEPVDRAASGNTLQLSIVL
ncbi:MAG: hypothetical protein HWE27_18910 [Gammaproteobacteria bacterium]|nr:hypothetical protein [Gammaproteobacteria bacterium]